ncbi:MAG: WD40 repeat domain-containing protein, partial [Planctomycetales bacterium]|nr:WD40 repeat domain-containing protein [Planctomycetales bacterium]
FLANKPIHARPISRISRLARLAQRNKLTTTFVVISAILLLSTATISSYSAWTLHQKSTELQSSLHRATRAEIAANQAKRTSDLHLLDSLMLQANTTRRTKAPGQRNGSLQTIRSAQTLLRSLEVAQDDLDNTLLKLRNEAVACLALPEYVCEHSWQIDSEGKAGISHEARLYAVSDKNGAIHIRRFEGSEHVVMLPEQGMRLARSLEFSPDGRFLAAMYGDDERFVVWRVDDAMQVVTPEPFSGPTCFFPDSSRIAICRYGDRRIVEIYDAESGKQTRSLKTSYDVYGLAVHPDNTKLATSFRNRILAIHNLEEAPKDNKAVMRMRLPFDSNSLQWSPTGSELCVGTDDGDIVILEFTPEGIRLNKVGSHNARVTRLCYLHGGSWLASRAHDSTTRVWDVDAARQEMTLSDSVLVSRNSDEGWLTVDDDLKKTVSAARVIPPAAPASTQRGRNSLAVHPSQPLAIVGSRTGVADVLHLNSMQLLGQLPIPNATGNVFSTVSPLGDIVTACSKGIHVWPVRTVEDKIHIGPARLLRAGSFKRMQFSQSGNTLVADGGSRALIVDMNDSHPDIETEEHEGLDNIAISPDGRFVATGTWDKRGVHVFDASNGKLVANLLPEFKTCSVQFSPDSQTLVTGTTEEYCVWNTADWKKLETLPFPTRSGVANVAFNAQRSWMALRMDRSIISLRHNGKELVQFHAFPNSRIEHIAISARGDFLVATTEHGCRSWDLKLVSDKLNELNLGGLDEQPFEDIDGRRSQVAIVVVAEE